MQRILSLLLVCCLVLSMALPAIVYAGDENNYADADLFCDEEIMDIEDGEQEQSEPMPNDETSPPEVEPSEVDGAPASSDESSETDGLVPDESAENEPIVPNGSVETESTVPDESAEIEPIVPNESATPEPIIHDEAVETEQPAADVIKSDDDFIHTPGDADLFILQGDSLFLALSGWEDDFEEFYVRIRLTVKDHNHQPIRGVVYGLYTANGIFVEYLTTDANGYAISSELPVDTDYYLEEHKEPDGFQPNTERKLIQLTEVCAPSAIDLTVLYDPVTGRIVVYKFDEFGQPVTGKLKRPVCGKQNSLHF